MTYQIYWISGSSYSWRALLGLAIKGVDYESGLLQVSEGEHKTPWFLEMNPRGKVPVLKDGNTVVYESLAILTYLDMKHPEPPLFGTTPEETARIWRTVSEVESYLQPPASAMIEPIFFGGLEKKVEEVKEAAKQAHEELGGLEKALATSSFLAGEDVSAADVVLFPVVQLLLRAMAKDEATPLDLGFLPLDERYPSLAAWVKRVEALPGYDKTYPPHWR